MWFCFNDVKQIVTTSFWMFIKLQIFVTSRGEWDIPTKCITIKFDIYRRDIGTMLITSIVWLWCAKLIKFPFQCMLLFIIFVDIYLLSKF